MSFKKSDFASMGGIVVGAISVIQSFIIGSHATGSHVTNSTYGGDAYTGIQNAAAAGARNAEITNDILVQGFSAILLVLGLALICYFVMKLLASIEGREPEKHEAKPQDESIAPSSTAAEDAVLTEEWECGCGTKSLGAFCPKCGAAKPANE